MSETRDQLDRPDPLVWKITAVAVLGSLMGQMDATVVNVSLSSLAIDLHSSLAAIQWVTSRRKRLKYMEALGRVELPTNGLEIHMSRLLSVTYSFHTGINTRVNPRQSATSTNGHS